MTGHLTGHVTVKKGLLLMSTLPPLTGTAGGLPTPDNGAPALPSLTPASAEPTAEPVKSELDLPPVIGQGLPPRVAGKQPPVATLFGHTKVGKSTVMAKVGCNWLHACRPGGMLVAASYLGLSEKWGVPPVVRKLVIDGKLQERPGYLFEWYVESVTDIPPLFQAAEDLGFSGVGVDDLTLNAETHAVALDKKFPARKDFGKKWAEIGVENIDLRRTIRYCGLAVAVSAHVRDPVLQANGLGGQSVLKGGAMFPMKKLGAAFAAESDQVFYMRRDPTKEGWNAVFDRTDIEYNGGDRLSVSPIVGPPNLRALWVQFGYTVPRFPTLEWQDDVMVAVRDRMLRGDDRRAVVNEEYVRLVSAGKAPPHIRWAIEDGLDLAEIAAYEHTRYLNDFFLEPLSTPKAMAGLTLGTPAAVVGASDD